MASNCTGIGVVGIGVRTTIYVQSLAVLLNSTLAAVMPKGRPWWRAEPTICRVLVVTSGCVLLNALAKAWYGQLPLAHMQVVLRLAWVASYAVHSAVYASWVHENFDLMRSLLLREPAPPQFVKEDGKTKLPGVPFGCTTTLHLMFTGAVSLWVFTRPSRFSTDTCGTIVSATLPSLSRRIFWPLVYAACMVPSYNHILPALGMTPIISIISIGKGMVRGLVRGHVREESRATTMAKSAPHAEHVARASGLVIMGFIAARIEAAVGCVKQWTLGQALMLLLAFSGLRYVTYNLWNGQGKSLRPEDEIKPDKSRGVQSL